MDAFSFQPFNIIEAGNAKAFAIHAERWLTQREAENHLMLATLARLNAEFQRGQKSPARFLTLQDGSHILAALIALPDVLHVTWASLEMIRIVSGLANSHIPVSAITGPGHVAFDLARAWSDHTGQTAQVERSDRVYQLARITYPLPPEGRLALATPDNLPVVEDWFMGMAREMESPVDAAATLGAQLVKDGQLYLWHQPGPVAMAAIAPATPSGVSLRHVYVPKGLRHNGHGKAIIAALAADVLASGKRYCFLTTDPANLRADMLLQRVGARTICEYARWRITPPYKPAPAATRG